LLNIYYCLQLRQHRNTTRSRRVSEEPSRSHYPVPTPCHGFTATLRSRRITALPGLPPPRHTKGQGARKGQGGRFPASVEI